MHVVFGTGAVGSLLLDDLSQRGLEVKGINRSGRPVANGAIDIVVGDASNPESAKSVARGATTIYQVTNPPYTKWPEMFPPIQKALIEAARANDAKLVSLENLYMYGPTGGQPLTEETPYRPIDAKGQVRAAMAEELLEVHRSGDIRTSIGRASDFFGPGALATHLGERVFYPALAGKNAQVFGDPSLLHTFSYTPDIARGLATLGTEDGSDGRAWHLPNPETLTFAETIEKVYEAAGTSGKPSPMPNLMVNLVALFNGNVREIKKVRYQFDEPFVVDSSAFVSTFGTSATPWNTALERTVDWYRAHPR